MEFHSDKNMPPDEKDRHEIRAELSKMSFEELKRLKGKLGSKVYNEAVHGKKPLQKTQFSRLNKNRPREVSSKVKPVFPVKVKEKRIIDPRFNSLCGTFNRKHFQNTYEFLSDIRKREKNELEHLLKKETDPEKIKNIKYLLERMNNQEREELKLTKRKEREEQDRKEQIEALKSGKKPHFKTKYEKKIVNLIDKYTSLKKSGKIEKYIEKKEKKLHAKDRKNKRYFEVNLNDENQ